MVAGGSVYLACIFNVVCHNLDKLKHPFEESSRSLKSQKDGCRQGLLDLTTLLGVKHIVFYPRQRYQI